MGPRARAGTAQVAAAAGDLVVVAIPLKAISDVPAKPLVGKAVIDTNNYYAAAGWKYRSPRRRLCDQLRAAAGSAAGRSRGEGVQSHLCPPDNQRRCATAYPKPASFGDRRGRPRRKGSGGRTDRRIRVRCGRRRSAGGELALPTWYAWLRFALERRRTDCSPRGRNPKQLALDGGPLRSGLAERLIELGKQRRGALQRRSWRDGSRLPARLFCGVIAHDHRIVGPTLLAHLADLGLSRPDTGAAKYLVNPLCGMRQEGSQQRVGIRDDLKRSVQHSVASRRDRR